MARMDISGKHSGWLVRAAPGLGQQELRRGAWQKQEGSTHGQGTMSGITGSTVGRQGDIITLPAAVKGPLDVTCHCYANTWVSP